MGIAIGPDGRLKTVEDEPSFKPEDLGNRGVRARLPRRPAGDCYWSIAGKGDAGTTYLVSYDARRHGGEWRAMWRSSEGRVNHTALGWSDDPGAPKGGLSYSEAKAKAEQWFATQARRHA